MKIHEIHGVPPRFHEIRGFFTVISWKFMKFMVSHPDFMKFVVFYRNFMKIHEIHGFPPRFHEIRGFLP